MSWRFPFFVLFNTLHYSRLEGNRHFFNEIYGLTIACSLRFVRGGQIELKHYGITSIFSAAGGFARLGVAFGEASAYGMKNFLFCGSAVC